MNTRYNQTPQFIASPRLINESGDETFLGDKVSSIQVMVENNTPVAQLDITNFKGTSNLIVEIELAELFAALPVAILNADKD